MNNLPRVLILIPMFLGLSSSSPATTGEWPHYGGDPGHRKYAPLDQIDSDNVGELEVVWRWRVPDSESAKEAGQVPGTFKATPLMIDGVLYTVTPLNEVYALRAADGAVVWSYDPQAYRLGRAANSGWQHRGVTYWSDGDDKRIYILTGTLELIALDAATGEAIDSFGENGRVDTLPPLGPDSMRRYIGNNAPVVVVSDTIVCGSTMFDFSTGPEMPPGHVRGYDVRTGDLKWVFHTIPREGEFGNDTWKDGSWEYTGNTNVWAPISADPELGYVYLPVSTPTNDYYGGHRKGDNVFAESIVCLDAATGERVWHFQAVHHGLWDYDFPAAPTLCDITVDGRNIKAVAAVSKQGFTYVFDRKTGKPVWPIEERPVPQSDVPGEETSPTQPFPTKPPAFVRQGFSEDDVIDFTPELKAAALEILKDYEFGPLFTPPTLVDGEGKKGVIQMPSAAGGANWGGSAFDPETGMLYLEAADQPSLASVRAGNKARGVQSEYLMASPLPPAGPQGLPFWKPPYAVVVAIDLNEGDIAWKVAHGDGPRDHPALKGLDLSPLGASSHGYLSSGGPLVTKTLLFVNQSQLESDFTGAREGGQFMHAFNKRTGEMVWEFPLELPPYGTPMTYLHAGRQYIAVTCGGGRQPAELLVFALPEN